MAVVPLDGGWGWVIVACASYIMFVINGTFMCFGILFVEFIEYFKVSRTRASYIGALISISIVIACVGGSMMIRKCGYRVTAIVGSTIATLSFFASFFADRIEILYFTYGLTGGFGAGLLWITCLVTINDYFDKKRSFALAVAMSGPAVGYGTWPYIYEYLMSFDGWRTCVITLACLWCQTIIAGALFRPLKKTPETANQKVTLFDLAILKEWKFHLYCLGNILWVFMLLPTLQSITDNCIHLGYSKDQAAMLFSILGWVMIPARLLSGYISIQKWMNRTLYASIALLIQGIVTIIYGFVTDYITLAVLTCLISIGISQIVILLPPILVDIFGPESMSAGYGYSQVYMLLTFGAAPLIAYLFDNTQSYNAGFLAMGGFGFCSSAIFLFLFGYERLLKKRSEEQNSGIEEVQDQPFEASNVKKSSSKHSLSSREKLDEIKLIENGTEESQT